MFVDKKQILDDFFWKKICKKQKSVDKVTFVLCVFMLFLKMNE